MKLFPARWLEFTPRVRRMEQQIVLHYVEGPAEILSAHRGVRRWHKIARERKLWTHVQVGLARGARRLEGEHITCDICSTFYLCVRCSCVSESHSKLNSCGLASRRDPSRASRNWAAAAASNCSGAKLAPAIRQFLHGVPVVLKVRP